jgi:eukaryotic-like serine/threonine-protein kinase
MTLNPGERCGRYKIISALGAGGMGEVFLAEDVDLERKVALKFLHEELSSDPVKLRRFVQEAKAASALNHPNILTVYEIGVAEGKNYIATEYRSPKLFRQRTKRALFTATSSRKT